MTRRKTLQDAEVQANDARKRYDLQIWLRPGPSLPSLVLHGAYVSYSMLKGCTSLVGYEGGGQGTRGSAAQVQVNMALSSPCLHI